MINLVRSFAKIGRVNLIGTFDFRFPKRHSFPAKENESQFQIFTTKKNSTLPILDGAMKITCGETAMSVKARLCTHDDFGPVQTTLQDNDKVR